MTRLTIDLPVKINLGHNTTDVTDLGVTYGQPPGERDLFREAMLPEGWTTAADDHPMWAHVLDARGRRRLSIFYGPNNALDRDAFMYVTSVYDYVTECVRTGQPPVPDDTWATHRAIAEAARERAKEASRLLRMYEAIPNRDWHIKRQVEIHALYIHLAEQFEESAA